MRETVGSCGPLARCCSVQTESSSASYDSSATDQPRAVLPIQRFAETPRSSFNLRKVCDDKTLFNQKPPAFRSPETPPNSLSSAPIPQPSAHKKTFWRQNARRFLFLCAPKCPQSPTAAIAHQSAQPNHNPQPIRRYEPACGTSRIVQPRPRWSLVVAWECKRILHNRLGDRARTNQSHWNATRYHGTVFDNLNSLQVLTVHALGNPRRLAAVTAEVLGFTALGLLVSPTRLQVAVQVQQCCTLDPLVLFQSAHSNQQFPAV